MSSNITLPTPRLDDPENPEWSAADFAQAVGPEALSAAELAAFPKTRRGRPLAARPKRQVTVRLSQDALDLVEANKPGWNGRLEAALMTSGVPAAITALMVSHREMIENLKAQITAMEKGDLKLIHGGNQDVTAAAIADAKARAAKLEALVYHYTPQAEL